MASPWFYSAASPAKLKPGDDFLQNSHHFPSFRHLPHEDDLNEHYWKMVDHGRYEYSCTWFFMAEITNDDFMRVPFTPKKILVRDRAGRNNIPIAFYPEKGIMDFNSLKKGHTVFVLQAEKHDFLDMSVGLRIEDLYSLLVVPCGLKELLALSSVYHKYRDTRCWLCGKSQGDGGSHQPQEGRESKDKSHTTHNGEATAHEADDELKKCARCMEARYCSKECQVKDWKPRHSRWCKAMPQFLKLTKIDYSKYDRQMHIYGPSSFSIEFLGFTS